MKIVHSLMAFIANKMPPPVHPADLKSNINVNAIANALEKTSKVLAELRLGGSTGVVNADAIATWEIIQASLQRKWMDAMIEVSTKGNFTFE
jgi:hypothetical protein